MPPPRDISSSCSLRVVVHIQILNCFTIAVTEMLMYLWSTETICEIGLFCRSEHFTQTYLIMQPLSSLLYYLHPPTVIS